MDSNVKFAPLDRMCGITIAAVRRQAASFKRIRASDTVDGGEFTWNSARCIDGDHCCGRSVWPLME